MQTMARFANRFTLVVIAALVALVVPAMAAAAPSLAWRDAASDPVILAIAAATTFWAGIAFALVHIRPRREARKPSGAGLEPQAEAVAVPPEASAQPREQQNDDEFPVLGYVSIPARANGRDEDEFRGQLQAIVDECRGRGLVLLDVVREREPHRGKGLERPGLGYALERIALGEARGLVVADLSRVSRSVTDLGEVLEWFSRAGARLVAVAPGLDTGDQTGQLAVRSLINISRWERERLSERTRKGLEAARREGRRGGRSGVADNPELCDRIARMRADGMTLQAIADRLNEAGVPTIRGGAKWRPSSVQAAAGYRRPRRGAPGIRVPGATGWPDLDEV
jgi:DNA invertase Pin-like site-specific DNA recombinase